jgi:hypothetical protein
MRAIDAWQLANLVTLFATTISMTLTSQWHAANARAARTETGAVLAILRLNLLLARLWFALNLAVWLLGGWLILVAHGIDVAASAAHPARVASWVVQGTVFFTCIWTAACAGVFVLKGRLDRLAATAEPAAPLRVIAPGARREKGGG